MIIKNAISNRSKINWKLIGVLCLLGLVIVATITNFNKIKTKSFVLNGTNFHPKTIQLYVKDKNWNKIIAKRDEALRDGIIETSDNDWVNGKLIDNKEEMDVSLRLKGDWLDHLKTDKWSFRIQVQSPGAWNRLATFSIQSPPIRNYLEEWLYHQFLQANDVLTTRYDFVNVSINNKPAKIFAYEEHFEKQLVEWRNRREGPILKFAEDGFWSGIQEQMQENISYNPFLHQPEQFKEAAIIRPFREKQTLKDDNLKNQFSLAQTMLKQYLTKDTIQADKIFDIKQMARYYATADIFGAYHGVGWHNERFYFNPITTRLEPIGYDGFPTEQSTLTLLGQGAMNHAYLDPGLLFEKVFADTNFVKLYHQYLEKYSEKKFFNHFLDCMSNEISVREKFLQQEYPTYAFDKNTLLETVSRVRVLLTAKNEISLHAFREDNGLDVKIRNTHGLPIAVVGYKQGKNLSIIYFDNAINIKGYAKPLPIEYLKVKLPNQAKIICFKVLGLDKIYESTILNWQEEESFVPGQALFENLKLTSNKFYKLEDKKIIFAAKKDTVTSPIIIPEGYEVIFPAGVNLNFIQSAFFISKSPVQMFGTADNPIRIYSSDKSANGFTVIQPNKKCQMQYVIFEQMNTLKYKGWQLTGGVTFYETELECRKCSFQNAQSEDAFNTVRCNVYLKEITINGTKSDGYDADFCKGNINNSTFSNTKNDGVDVSGSNFRIRDCHLSNNGDKGISVGEQSTVRVENTTVIGSNIGIASKDLSEAMVASIRLKDCQQGFVGYQKKPEFGGSKMFVENYEAINVKKLYRVLRGCELQLKDRHILGTE